MSMIEAVILGFIQGITEFLPISSSGHLVLANDFLGVLNGGSLAFDAILHLATATAIVCYFHKDLWVLLQAVLRRLSRLPVNDRDITMAAALAVGTVPAVIAGLLLEDIMATLFRNPLLVAGSLIAGSFLFVYAEWFYYNTVPQNTMTWKKGLQVGLFQCLALVPGFSRSGATIAGGMLLGLSRSEAARFGFLLAVPLLLGAGAKKLLDLISSGDVVAWGAVAAGAITAFLIGLLAIHFMISFVRRYSLWPFIWYRVMLALLVIYIFALS
ncbi:MAG: undecaprenyl-diphosphatase [Candidatus Parcubacteria bacterium]